MPGHAPQARGELQNGGMRSDPPFCQAFGCKPNTAYALRVDLNLEIPSALSNVLHRYEETAQDQQKHDRTNREEPALHE